MNLSASQGDFMINNELLRYLVKEGYKWIVDQRNLHIGTAQELSEQDKISLQPYFEPEMLDLAKIDRVDHIENPPFYSEIIKLGIPNLINFTQMDGISFIDCILISCQKSHTPQSWISLLFHEMVHIVQYELLGAKRFADCYVKGWVQNSFNYERIPLERQAYSLQRQYDQGGNVFSVVQLLNQQLGCGG